MDEEVGVLEQAAIKAGFNPKKPVADKPSGAVIDIPAGDKPTPTEDDIPEEKLLAALSKKTGRTITSLEDFNKPAEQVELTPAEKEQQAKDKKTKALQFGLSSNKIKGADELQQYLKEESLSPRGFAFERFKAERLAENKELTAEDIENEFIDENFELMEETDPRRIRAAKRMEAGKQQYIQNTYGHILNIDKEYDEHLSDTVGMEKYAKRIEPLVPQNLSFDFEDTDADDKKVAYSYPFIPTKETIEAVAKEFKGDLFYGLYEKSGKATDKEIREAIEAKIILKELPRILKEVSNAHAEKKEATRAKGRRGIPNEREPVGSTVKTGGGGILDAAYERHKNTLN